MRVGLVAMSSPKLGGTYQYTLSMIEALKGLPEVHLTLFVPYGNEAYVDLGLPLVRLPGFGVAIGQMIRRGLGASGSVDDFSGIDLLVAPIYTTRLLSFGRPFVYTLHDLQERYYPGNFTLAQRLWRAISNQVLTARAAGVICESEYVRSDIEKFLKVDRSRIFVIPGPPVSSLTAVDLKTQELAGLKASLSLPDDFVFYPAQLFPHKNHVRLIRAFARLGSEFRDVHLLFTGDKRYEYQRILRCAEELGLSGRVRYLGYIDTQSLAAAYRLARCVAIPTLFESISIPMYEAFSLGVPVCASNVFALPEQAGDAALLFDPLSVDDIAEKLASMLGDDELRGHLVARGRIRIAAQSMGKYTEQLGCLLSRVAPVRTSS